MSSPAAQPRPPGNPPPAAERDLNRLIAHFSLPPSTATLARSILAAAYPHSSPDPYHTACAVYVAALSDRPSSTLPVASLLSATPGQLLITDFFDRAKLIAADASSRLRVPPPRDPASAVHASHRAFMTAADVFRKLAQLKRLALLVDAPLATRVAWLTFLVAKAHLTAPTASPLATVSAFHLLIASTVEAGLVPNAPPLNTLCAATAAVPAEVERFRIALRNALPPTIRRVLPFRVPNLPTAVATLDAEYAALLATASDRLVPDERVFVDAPHLLAPSPHHSPPNTPPQARGQPPTSEHASTPLRSPHKKRRMSDQQGFHTPRTRKDVLRRKMSLTPRENPFSKFVGSSSGADALDALAAVASSAPHSPAVSRSTSATRSASNVPATPISSGCAAVSWLKKLANDRPETEDDEHFFDCKPIDTPTTEAMMRVLKSRDVWAKVVETVRTLSEKLREKLPDLAGMERRREAMAVFFAAFESVLLREDTRLKARKERPWVIDNVGRASSIHKSLLLCSWEVTSAAYGRRNFAVFNAAIEAFEIPAFDIVKIIEPFARLPDMPRPLATHINLCGVRVLECTAWKPGSKLVKYLRERSLERAAKKNSRQDPQAERTSNNNADPGKTEPAIPENATREFALEFFFKKLLSVASDRAQELLMRLHTDVIAEPVWASIKYAVWEKWHLMVDRHVDQIIMCCIYGVAKVQQLDLKFKDIIQSYQTMSHVREPSFCHYLPGVFRAVSLRSHLDLMPPGDTNPPRYTRNGDIKDDTGDIIKLYNQVFIHAMKSHILAFQDPIGSPNTISARSSVASTTSPEVRRTLSTSATSMRGSCIQNSAVGSMDETRSREENNDSLNDKVMSSPMRVLLPHASPRRMGRVTVTPMSPGGRSLVAIRQSPARRGAGTIVGSMTPGTRKLYAFGESPVRTLDTINRSLVQDDSDGRGGNPRRPISRRPVPLNFDGSGVGQRTASVRRRFADVLSRRPSRQPMSSVQFGAIPEGTQSAASGSDALSRSNGIDSRGTIKDDGSAAAGA